MSTIGDGAERLGGPRAEGVSVLVHRALAPGDDPPARRRRSAAEAELAAWRSGLPEPSRAADRAVTPQAGNCRNSIGSGICDPARPAAPAFTLWLELEERCNLDCLFCYNSWRPTGTDPDARPVLRPERLLDILTNLLSELPIVQVTLSGGEPLMYPGIVEVADHLARWSPVLGLTTNGRSATRRRLRALADAGLAQIAVPVHSHEPAIHNHLTGGQSWHAAVRALALGRELGLDVTMSAVVTRHNADDIGGICQIVDLLGLDSLVLNCFHPTGQGLLHGDDLSPTAAAFDTACTTARRILDGRAEVAVGSPAPPSGGGAAGSPAVKSSIDRLVLSPYGDVKFCNQSAHGVVNVANGEPDEWPELLRRLRTGDHGPLLGRVDGCSCLTPVG